MVSQGVATMILESPYYGSRRPPWQEGSKLRRVSDLLTLGRATIEESLYLLAWAQRQQFRHLGAPQACPSVNMLELFPIPGSTGYAVRLASMYSAHTIKSGSKG